MLRPIGDLAGGQAPGAEKRRQHGSKGAIVFRDPSETDRVWVAFDWGRGYAAALRRVLERGAAHHSLEPSCGSCGRRNLPCAA